MTLSIVQLLLSFCGLILFFIHRAVLINIPLIIIVYSLTCMVGFVVFAFYQERGCDPLRSGEIGNSNQVGIFASVVYGPDTDGMDGMGYLVI